ncbi:unnamed protein product [Allacma fusca]|uniref:Uncharacterized protein n=1 Tax=Allacma fusca TaxID=39272 RepID=A0A8J2JKE2_9HEXA|nr:unnamed protein product [Allacma fusca]
MTYIGGDTFDWAVHSPRSIFYHTDVMIENACVIQQYMMFFYLGRRQQYQHLFTEDAEQHGLGFCVHT